MRLRKTPRPHPRVSPSFLAILVTGLFASGALLLAQGAAPAGSQSGAPPAEASGAPEGAGSKLTVPQAAIGTDVKEREIVGAGTQFPSSVGRLYCLTKIAGAAEPTKVTHLWFHEDKQVHKVDLPVNGTTWRTWSYKTIPPGWTGSWRVDVEDANGTIIYSIPFTISGETAHQNAESPKAAGNQESH